MARAAHANAAALAFWFPKLCFHLKPSFPTQELMLETPDNILWHVQPCGHLEKTVPDDIFPFF